VALGGRRWPFEQEELGAGVHRAVGEHAPVGGELEGHVGQAQLDGGGGRRHRWFDGEVVVIGHRGSLARPSEALNAAVGSLARLWRSSSATTATPSSSRGRPMSSTSTAGWSTWPTRWSS